MCESTFDVRGVSLSKGRHWSSPAIFGPRAKFNANSDPATLDIDVRIICNMSTFLPYRTCHKYV
uniref:Uncharacterized protein n=1 Tax=Phlebotomus papatasi TaxID=29031 RepID=A0A1B0DDY4_PHLPP